MTKPALFELIIRLNKPDEKSKKTAAKFGDDQSPQSIAQNFWVLVFATFKIKEPGDWKIVVPDDCSQVALSHTDQALLAHFAESFRDYEYRTWHPSRLGMAFKAYLEMIHRIARSKE
jgi:hypothetical protein